MGIEISLAMSAVSLALGAVAAKEQGAALDRQNKAIAAQAKVDIEELDRQREFADDKARAQKSDRVTEAERDTARIINGMWDMGGGGGANETRLTAETAAYEGVDLSRIEGNRKRQGGALRSQQLSIKAGAGNGIAMNMSRKRVNNFKFLSSAASAGASAFRGSPATKKTDTPKADT